MHNWNLTYRTLIFSRRKCVQLVCSQPHHNNAIAVQELNNHLKKNRVYYPDSRFLHIYQRYADMWWFVQTSNFEKRQMRVKKECHESDRWHKILCLCYVKEGIALGTFPSFRYGQRWHSQKADDVKLSIFFFM